MSVHLITSVDCWRNPASLGGGRADKLHTQSTDGIQTPNPGGVSLHHYPPCTRVPVPSCLLPHLLWVKDDYFSGGGGGANNSQLYGTLKLQDDNPADSSSFLDNKSFHLLCQEISSPSVGRVLDRRSAGENPSSVPFQKTSVNIGSGYWALLAGDWIRSSLRRLSRFR